MTFLSSVIVSISFTRILDYCPTPLQFANLWVFGNNHGNRLGFPEPWTIVLYDNLMQGRSDDSFSFSCPSRPVDKQYERPCYLWIPADRGMRQCLREAIELFTILSVVDNRVFADELPQNPENSLRETDLISFPTWELWPAENLHVPVSSNAIDTSITWDSFLGFSDEYSPEFLVALQQLENTGLEDGNRMDGTFRIDWSFENEMLCSSGAQKFEQSATTAQSFWGEFRKLFSGVVPPIVHQQFGTRGRALVEPWWSKPHLLDKRCWVTCATISKSMNQSEGFLDMVSAMARTPTSLLCLSLKNIPDSPQSIRNAGALLNEVLHVCGSTDEIKLNCFSISNKVFASISSAVAELSPDVHLSTLDMRVSSPDQWIWMVYGLCCGISKVDIPRVELSISTVKKPVISSIAETLRVGNPVSVSKLNNNMHCTYGFVNIPRGTEVYVEFEGGDDLVVVLPRPRRCRACYDSTNGGWVDAIVPGYGTCKAKIGESVEFTPDPAMSNFSVKQLSGSLELRLHSAELLMDLLALVAGGLRTLILQWYSTEFGQLDLCALSAACPELHALKTDKVNVVVSAYESTLRHWPIKRLVLKGIQHVSSLLPLLSDPKLRSSRKLVKLKVTARDHERFDKEEVEMLTAHNGEFLSVVKEKFPIQSKIAMISAVTRADSTEAIHYVDSCILSQIFVFASTPEQRVV